MFSSGVINCWSYLGKVPRGRQGLCICSMLYTCVNDAPRFVRVRAERAWPLLPGFADRPLTSLVFV